MDPYVLKIEHGGVRRRLTLPAGSKVVFSYAQLQRRARDLFRLPATVTAAFTYVDRDGDVVDLADDQDLEDALVLQRLNPLKLTMTRRASQANSSVKEEPEQTEKHECIIAPKNNVLLYKSIRDGRFTGKREDERGEEQTVNILEDGAAENSNVHRGIRCDGCDMEPIRGPRFKSSRKLRNGSRTTYESYDLCLRCFDKKNEVEQAEYIEINRRIYRLRNPVEDTNSLAAAFSLSKLGDSALQEDDSSDKCRQVIHHCIQCSGCGIKPIKGVRFNRKRAGYDLCFACFQKSKSDGEEYCCFGGPVASGASRPKTNKSFCLVIPHRIPAYICERWVWLLDGKRVVLDQATVKPLTAAQHLGPKFVRSVPEDIQASIYGTSSSDMVAPAVAAQPSRTDLFPAKAVRYLAENRDSEEATFYTFSEENTIVLFRYTVQSYNGADFNTTPRYAAESKRVRHETNADSCNVDGSTILNVQHLLASIKSTLLNSSMR